MRVRTAEHPPAQLEGTPLHDPGGDAGAEPTALVAWLRGTIRAAICSVEAAAREALAGETGLLFSMEALAQAVWEVVERAAEFVEMCSTIGAAPPGPNPGLTQPDSIDVGSPEWALASLRCVFVDSVALPSPPLSTSASP